MDVLLIINECDSSWFVVAHVTFVLLVATVLCQLESFLFSLLFFVDLVGVWVCACARACVCAWGVGGARAGGDGPSKV